MQCNAQCNNSSNSSNKIQVAKCQKPKRQATEKCPTCNQSKCNRIAAPTSARTICCNLQHNRKRQQSRADQPTNFGVYSSATINISEILFCVMDFRFFLHFFSFFTNSTEAANRLGQHPRSRK